MTQTTPRFAMHPAEKTRPAAQGQNRSAEHPIRMRPLFYQAWIATPQDVQKCFAGGPQAAQTCGVHAWIFLCRDVEASRRAQDLLPDSVRSRSWIFHSLTGQLNQLLKLMHQLLQRGVAVAIVCETGRQRAPALWAAYLLWQTQQSLDTILRVFRDVHPDLFQPEPLYLDLLQYVEKHRRSLM